MTRTIDMTPTWAALMPVLIAALVDGTAQGQASARAELMDLARRVDELNARPIQREEPPPALEHEESMSAADLSPADWIAAHAAVSNNQDLSTEARHRIMSALESFAESALEALESDGKLCGFHQFVSPETGETFGSFELFHDAGEQFGTDDGQPTIILGKAGGFYWHSKFPGCLPDGDTSGPFETAKEAWTDAQGS